MSVATGMIPWSLHEGAQMSRRRTRSNGNGGVAGVIGVLFAIGLVIKFFWWIVGVLAVVSAFYVIRAVLRNSQAAAAAQQQATAAIAARADEQHSWVLQGDDRGIYGPDGAKLMHYIDGGISEEIVRKSQPKPAPRTGPFGTRFTY
jgi:uncharacterized membrane protein